MSRMGPLLVWACVAVVPAIGQGQPVAPNASPDRVTINDNRTAAGVLNDSLRLTKPAGAGGPPAAENKNARAA